MVKRFVQYYKPVRLIFILDMICALAVALCDLFYPMITRNIINDYVPNQNLRLLITWLIILFLIYVIKYGLNYFITYYGHLSKIYVKNGSKVKANAKIANSGNTGRSTGAHLHFEIRRSGIYLNPLEYVSYS